MALSARCLLFLAAYLAVCLDANVLPGQLPVSPKSNGGCITMTPDIMRYCSYNRTCTTLPNVKGHKTLQEANDEFRYFIPLIDRAKCSPLLEVFLCFYYFPIVPPTNLGRSAAAVSAHQFLPCRSVCESVRDDCEPSIIRYRPEVGGWPDHLNCSRFPDDSTTPSCIKPATPPSTTAPPTTSTTAPPTTSTTAPSTTSTTAPSTTSTTAPSTRPPTKPTTTTAPTMNHSGESSGSGEMPPTNTTASTSTTASPPPVCIQPETNQSQTCSCAKVRPNISKRTLKKGLYSFVAKVKILSSTTMMIQRGGNKISVMGYRARIEENFPVSCSTSRLQAGKEITLRTDMSPGCLCAIIEVNREYVVAGYSTTELDVMHIPTDKKYKYGNNGGCVFGCWQSKYLSRINGYLQTERPLTCSI